MMDVATVIAILGSVLFVLALLGGGIALKEISIPPIPGKLRVVLFPLGAALIASGVWLSRQPAVEPGAAPPPVVPTQAIPPTPVPQASPTTEPPSTLQPGAEVSVYCGYIGESPVYVSIGQPVTLQWKWGAASDAYRQDYIDAAAFHLRFDAQVVNLSAATPTLHACDQQFCVTWRLPPMVLSPGSHEAILTVALSREITDGFDLDQDGNLDVYGPSEWTAPPCEIIVQ